MYHVDPLFTLVSVHLICIFVNIFPHFSFDGPYHVNPLFTLSLLGNIFSAQIICIFVKIFTHFSFDEPSSPSFQSRRTLEKFVNIWFYSRDWKTCILGKYFCVVTVMAHHYRSLGWIDRHYPCIHSKLLVFGFTCFTRNLGEEGRVQNNVIHNATWI